MKKKIGSVDEINFQFLYFLGNNYHRTLIYEQQISWE